MRQFTVHRKEARQMSRNKETTGSIVMHTVWEKKWLSLGILVAVCTAIVTALLPPLILGDVVDSLTQGQQVNIGIIVLYFGLLVLTGIMESAREGLLTVFGQKDHTYAEKPSDGEIHTPVSRFDQSSGAWLTGIKIRRGCGYGGESVHIRYYQYVCRCLQDHQYSCCHMVS